MPANNLTLSEAGHRHYDLVVVGATPSGIACAVRAAREGLAVLLTNHQPHLGGFLTSGAGGWEAPSDQQRSPIYAEVRNRITAYYAATYGEGSPQHLASMPSPHTNSHLDRAKVEPRIAEKIFEEMLGEESQIHILRGVYPVAARRDGRRLLEVTLREMHGITEQIIRADCFVDSMMEADLAAVAGVPCRIGRESREEYGEPHAGVIYMTEKPKPPGQPGFPRDAVEGRIRIRYNSHATEHILSESTGEADDTVMGYNFRLILTKERANKVPIPKPENYDPDILAKTIGNRSIVPDLPNNKIAWNGCRMAGPQKGYPNGDWPERERIMKIHIEAALSLLWFWQNDPAASPEDREFWKDYGLAADEFPDNGHLPYEIYVREARRIVGRYVFTEHDGVVAPGAERTPIHPDSVAITDWPIDSVACTMRRVGDSHFEGAFFLAEESRPAMVPYRCLLPQDLDNLLVPVALSASHVGFGCLRLEPVWMQTGEAAGWAAALARKLGTTPGQLDSDILIRTLATHHHMVAFFNDVEIGDIGAGWIPAVQFFATKGFFASYDARPNDPLDAETAARWATLLGPSSLESNAGMQSGRTRAETCRAVFLRGG